MNKPEPKYELVVADCETELHLYPASNDAVTWIKQEAPSFGALDDTSAEYVHRYILRLFPNYDSMEVAIYLASMGSDDTNSNTIVRKQGRQVYPAVVHE